MLVEQVISLLSAWPRNLRFVVYLEVGQEVWVLSWRMSVLFVLVTLSAVATVINMTLSRTYILFGDLCCVQFLNVFLLPLL